MLLSFGAHRVAPVYLQRVAPFFRTLTTTTDWQTSHRSRGPQKRLCRRRAAASPGAACRARLRSRRSRGPWAHNLWRGRTRRWSPYSRWRSCAGLPQTSGSWGRGEGTWRNARNRKAESKARRDTHEDDHVDEVKSANILSLSHCGWCEDKTTLTDKRKCALHSCGCQWKWSVVSVSWSVIGIRVVVSPSHRLSTFLNFPLRVQILILSCCSSSSSLFPVDILCTRLHRGNMSFEVWYLHELTSGQREL